MPPEDALIQAVADALIRFDASLPAQTVMHLYPRFPALTVILLARVRGAQQPLLDIFQGTRHRDLWLAAGNLLVANPPPGFVRALLQYFFVSFVFRVVEPAGKAVDDGVSGGCAGDMYMMTDERFRDWPRMPICGERGQRARRIGFDMSSRELGIA